MKKKNQSKEANLEMKQMLKVDKSIETIVINIFYIFLKTKLSVNVEVQKTKRTQVEFIEMKTILR